MRKKLIVVAAPPASGKTYVAKAISLRIGNVGYIDKDALAPLVSSAFRMANQPFDMDGEFYRENIRPHEYETIYALSLELLAVNDTVIVNAPFGRELRDPSAFLALKKRLAPLQAELILLWIESTPALCRARMQARGEARDQGKLADWESYVSGISFLPPKELLDAGAIDRLLIFQNQSDAAFRSSMQKLLSVLS